MRSLTWLARLGLVVAAGALLTTAVAVAVAPRLWQAANAHEELPTTLPPFQPLARRSLVYDRNGDEIAIFEAENSQPISLSQVPQQVIDAFLAVEDKEFHGHHGVNFRSLVRAALSNFSSDAPQQGASTITMQVVKNDFLAGLERDGRYKLLQIHYALMLEREYSKEQILQRYLNTVFFGNNAYGIQAAAEVYFGKTAAELRFTEAVFLAGLVRAPSAYDPINEPDASRRRFTQVLEQLADDGYYTKRQAARIGQELRAPRAGEDHARADAYAHVLHRGPARLPAQQVEDPRRDLRGALLGAVPRWVAHPHDVRSLPPATGGDRPRRAPRDGGGHRGGHRRRWTPRPERSGRWSEARAGRSRTRST